MFNLFLVILTFSSPVLIIIFMSKYFKYKSELSSQLNELRKEIDGKSTTELQTEVTALTQRVETLEAIVTDSGYELNKEISSL